MRNLIYPSLLLLVSTTLLMGQVRTSSQAGSWNDTNTWGGASVPASTDDVTITHAVTMANNQAAKSITITNTGTSEASLRVSGGVALSVTNDVDVTATNAAYDTEFNIVSGTITIGGDLNLTTSNTNNQNVDIFLDNTSSLTATNLNLTATNCPVVGSGPNLRLRGTSDMDIAATTTLFYNTSNQNNAYEINLNVDESGTFETNDLVMNSNSSSGSNNANNIVRTASTSTSTANLTVVNDISFIAASFEPTHFNSSVNKIRVWGSGTLALGGFYSFSIDYNATNFAWEFADSGTFELNGAAAQTVPKGKNDIFQNIKINNSAGVTMTDHLDIFGTLILTEGVLNTDGYNLTIQDGGTATEGTATSFVDGPVKKIGVGDFIFPTGDGSIWARVAIAGLTGDANTEFTAEYFAARHTDYSNVGAGLNNVSGGEYWDLAHGGTASDADVTLYWESATDSEITNSAAGLSDLKIAHYTGTEWENLGNGGTTGEGLETGTITVAGVASFSPFTFGSNSNFFNSLPIELIHFSGQVIENKVELNWITASEVNNDFFMLERSVDGQNFTDLERIDGAGQSKELVYYTFTDYNPMSPISYYRLRQVDFDGTIAYSPVVRVEIEAFLLKDEVKIYPNLIPKYQNSLINMNVPGISGREYKIQVITTTGKIINEYAGYAMEDIVTFNVSAQDNDSIYIISLQVNDQVFAERIVIK